MKIAIVCDWLVTFAGAEKLLAEIIRCFPQADLFAVIDFLSSEDRKRLQNKRAKTTFIQHLPFAKQYYRHYLSFMPLAIEQLDVSAYDVVISSSHAVAKGVITGPNQLHICCNLSPIRYAWDLQHQYLSDANLTHGLKGMMAKMMLHKIRLWDTRTANGVDHFIAISHYIAKRIQKCYRRDSTVIYPPVDVHAFTPGHKKEHYYLTASRMVPYKKMDLIVEAFSTMPDKQLVVIGDGPDFRKIQSKASNNVTLLGYQSHEVLRDHLQRAKAFLFAAEEDFGIAPIEAQACGTPVIAYGKGAALETISGIDTTNPSGLFFEEHTIDSIRNALKQFEKNAALFTKDNCVNNAARFSPDIFRERFETFVKKIAEQ